MVGDYSPGLVVFDHLLFRYAVKRVLNKSGNPNIRNPK